MGPLCILPAPLRSPKTSPHPHWHTLTRFPPPFHTARIDLIQELEHSGKAKVLRRALLQAFPSLAAGGTPSDLTSLVLRLQLSPAVGLDAVASEAPAALRLQPRSYAAQDAARTQGITAGWEVEAEEEAEARKRGAEGGAEGAGEVAGAAAGATRALALPALTNRDLSPGAYPAVLLSGGEEVAALLSPGGALHEAIERVVAGPPQEIPEREEDEEDWGR